jgi:hypothetical protein
MAGATRGIFQTRAVRGATKRLDCQFHCLGILSNFTLGAKGQGTIMAHTVLANGMTSIL